MAKSERLLQEIREVLLHEWDPIGIGHNPDCINEYDRYARTIFRYLTHGTDEYRLSAYLAHTRAVNIGLNAVDSERDRTVARRLLSLRTR